MFFNKCECSYISDLVIETNSIQKKYIKICTKHATSVFTEASIKEQYKFSKKKNIYLLRNRSNLSLTKLRRNSSNDSTDTESVINFGKYSGESFQEVYEKDKRYCFNILRITDRKEILPNGMFTFSNFVKESLKTS